MSKRKTWRPDGWLGSDRVFVNILLLSIVNAHKRLYRFDHALRVADQIPIRLGWGEPVGEPVEKP